MDSNSLKKYQNILSNFLMDTNKEVCDISEADIRKWIADLPKSAK